MAAEPFAEQVAANVKLLFSKPNGVMVQSIFVQLFKEDMAPTVLQKAAVSNSVSLAHRWNSAPEAFIHQQT